MSGLTGVYWTLIRTALAEQLQYRAAMVIWLIGRVVQPVIYLAVWTIVAQARGGTAGGYSVRDFAAYFIVVMMVEHVTFTWNMFERTITRVSPAVVSTHKVFSIAVISSDDAISSVPTHCHGVNLRVWVVGCAPLHGIVGMHWI